MSAIIFYVILVVLVLNDVYYLFNKRRLISNFQNRDLLSVRRLDLAYYTIKAVSIFWPFIGLFSDFQTYFLCVVVLWLLRFVIYHLSKKFYTFYALIVPFVIDFIYISVFVFWITR